MADPILVLDDERTYAEMLGDLLADNGFDAEVATDPVEALDRLHQRSFSLIVLDFKMPEVDGAEFLTKARRIVPQIPVIMVSGLMTTPDLLKVANIGVTLVLEKPFKVDEFLDTVRRFVNPVGGSEGGPSAHGEAGTIPEEDAESYPRPVRFLADQSEASRRLLQQLWEVHRTGSRHIPMQVPPGGEFAEAVREVAAWKGHLGASPYHFSFSELDAPEVRRALEELSATDAAPCIAVSLPEAVAADAGVFERFVRWVESERRIAARFVFMYAFPIDADLSALGGGEGLPDVISGVLRMEPLRDRLGDLAVYVERFLERLPKQSRAVLEPAAAGVLLQYEWPGNHRELLGVLRRVFRSAGGGAVRGEQVQAAIRARHGNPEPEGLHLDLRSFLLVEQRRFLREHAAPDADLKTLAEVTGLGLDRLRAGRPPADQPLLFPELATDETDYLKDDDDGPRHQ